MLKLAEMRQRFPIELHGGVVSTTTDVWSMLAASKEGDLETVESLGRKCEELLWCQYDYTTPMQFAVREGHADVVEFLIAGGALDKHDRNHPFLEALAELAVDRGYGEIVEILHEASDDPQLVHDRGDCGRIQHQRDAEQEVFQEVIDGGRIDEAEAMLGSRPDLVEDELAFWGEGVLSVPCKSADLPMIEMLMARGATVPRLSKWGARYYFKHYDIAKLLLSNGMDPNHSNWRGFTLLHDMAFTGDIEKATLLVDNGADLGRLDEEYHSTPLGYAAHFGHHEVVKLLLERGADVNEAGRTWATPLEHSRRKGRSDIENTLISAGAE